jgi:hypothetical protein
MTSFAKFLEAEAGRKAVDPEILDRLVRSGAKIEMKTALLTFMRERWPDHYPPDFRKDSGTPFGREAMRRLWREYLSWSEAAPDRKATAPKAIAS